MFEKLLLIALITKRYAGGVRGARLSTPFGGLDNVNVCRDVIDYYLWKNKKTIKKGKLRLL